MLIIFVTSERNKWRWIRYKNSCWSIDWQIGNRMSVMPSRSRTTF